MVIIPMMDVIILLESMKIITVNVFTSTADVTSTITAGGMVEPGTISSTIDTDPEKINAFDFTFTDAGSGDGQPTTIGQIVVTQGTLNDFANWAGVLGGVYITGPDLPVPRSPWNNRSYYNNI